MSARVGFFTAAVMLVMVAVPLAAAEKVWSGLVMAENVPQPHPPPPQLASFEKTLSELFGYNQFDLIGESSKILKTGQEDWMATSKYFALKVDARGANASGYDLGLKLYKEQLLLLETDTKLSADSPLVIKGPQVGSGQLILVLTVNDENAKDDAPRQKRHTDAPANPALTAIRRLTRFVRSVWP